MSFNPDIHHRRSVRLPGYDYSQNGAYFITICTQNRECLFGEIQKPVGADPCVRPPNRLYSLSPKLNDTGKMIDKWWIKLKNNFPHIELDEYVIMPNHLHGIIFINDDQLRKEKGRTHGAAPTGRMVQWFKTMTTNEYIRRVKNGHWKPFPGRLWQRDYYEHIIRNEESLEKIREYIVNNPMNWDQDEMNT